MAHRVVQLLESIDSKLDRLLDALANPVKREFFSVKEVGDMSKKHGVRGYSQWWIRDACRTGKIHAKPNGPNGAYLIPRAEMERILSEGLSNETTPAIRRGGFASRSS